MRLLLGASKISKGKAYIATPFNGLRIRLDQDPFRIELEYATSPDLPLPWPHRIRRILTHRTQPATEPYEITIYAARISEYPLDDAAFIPWRYLKAGTYVRGKALLTGGLLLRIRTIAICFTTCENSNGINEQGANYLVRIGSDADGATQSIMPMQ